MKNQLRDAVHPALPKPFGGKLSPEGVQLSPALSNLVHTQVRALLDSSPAFYQLSESQQTEMRSNLEKIAAYTAALIRDEWAASEQLGQRPVPVQQTTISQPQAENAPTAATLASKGPA